MSLPLMQVAAIIEETFASLPMKCSLSPAIIKGEYGGSLLGGFTVK